MEQNGKARIGIIGCGQIARTRHIPELAVSRYGEIAGFYDFIPEHAEAMRSQYGGIVYKQYQDMLKDTKVDGVVICTSNDSHARISMEALALGKYVLCEKPMCMTLEEAKAVLDADAKSGKFYMAAHNQRLNLGNSKAREILLSGKMGKVLSFKCTLAHSGPERYSINRSNSTWYLSKKTSGLGCISDLGIHKCDVIRYVLGEPFVQISAFAGTRDKKDENGNPADVYDNAVCILKTKSGIMGSLNLSYTNYGTMENSTVYYCEKGVMKAQYYPDCVLEVIMDSGEKIRYIDSAHPSSRVTDTFAKAIMERTASPIPAKEAYDSMRTVFAIEESARTGQIVNL